MFGCLPCKAFASAVTSLRCRNFVKMSLMPTIVKRGKGTQKISELRDCRLHFLLLHIADKDSDVCPGAGHAPVRCHPVFDAPLYLVLVAFIKEVYPLVGDAVAHARVFLWPGWLPTEAHTVVFHGQLDSRPARCSDNPKVLILPFGGCQT